MAVPKWKWGIEEKTEPKPQPVRRIPRWKRGISKDTRTIDVPKGIVVSRAGDKPPEQRYKGDELSYLLEYAEPEQSTRLKRVATGEDEELRSKLKGIGPIEERKKTALFFARRKHIPIIKRAKTLHEEGKHERAEETLQQIWVQLDPLKRITQSIFQDAAEDAYGSLTSEEKHDYGFLFTDWKDIAGEERKFHYGGMKHLKSLSKEEQIGLGKEYFERETKKGLGDFDITEFGTKMAGGIYKYGDSKKVWKEKSYEYMWEKMSTPSGKLKDIYFAKLPAPVRWWTSGSHAAASFALFPVTLPQTGVKLLTGGKTLLLPDVGKSLERHRPGSPLDIMSVAMSEGIGAYTGKGSGEWERFQKDIISGAFATGGAAVGLLTGTTALKLGVGIPLKYGLKSAIKGMPKMYGKLSSYTGTRFSYLTGGRFAKAETFGNILGKTKFAKNLYGWSTGQKVFVKTYPIAKGFPKTHRMGEQFARITKFKGFGRRELVHPSSVTPISKSLSGYMRVGDPSRFDFRMMFKDVSAKGFFRKTITTRYGSTGATLWPKSSTIPYYVKGSLKLPYIAVKKGGIVSKGFLSSKDAYATLVRQIHMRPMIRGGMHHLGYLGKETISIPASASSSLFGAVGYGTALLTVGALNTEMQQANLGLSVSRSALKRISAYENVSIQTGIQNLGYAQMQKQMQLYKMKSLTELEMSYSTSSTHGGRGKPSTISTPFSFKIPKIAFWLPGDRTRRKKKSFFDITPPDFAYHERVHPTRNIEEMFNFKSIKKSMDGSIDKDIKKLMKGFNL